MGVLSESIRVWRENGVKNLWLSEGPFRKNRETAEIMASNSYFRAPIPTVRLPICGPLLPQLAWLSCGNHICEIIIIVYLAITKTLSKGHIEQNLHVKLYLLLIFVAESDFWQFRWPVLVSENTSYDGKKADCWIKIRSRMGLTPTDWLSVLTWLILWFWRLVYYFTLNTEAKSFSETSVNFSL
jgi:hypothetical protein